MPKQLTRSKMMKKADQPTQKAKTAIKAKKKKKKSKPVKVSYHRRPEDMTLDLWQLGLRKQFGEENLFEVSKSSGNSFFAEYEVWNPTTRNAYQVAIRTGLPLKGLPIENSLTCMGNTCTCQDFKTNRLGLCKHISATLHHIGKKRGSKTAMRKPFRDAFSAIYVDYRETPRLRLFMGEQNESELLVWMPRWFDAEGFMTEKGIAQFDTVIQEARKIQPGMRCYSNAMDLVADKRDNLYRQARLAETLPLGAASPYLDSLLKVNFFPFQKTGVWFAANAGRCLIADEMGLGKTIQAIGAAELLRRELAFKRFSWCVQLPSNTSGNPK